MYVTPEVKARVIAKLQEGIALAEAHYGMKFSMPTITYTLRGTTAGTAAYRTWTVNFNAGLLMENIDDFIARTVPHELAHLINDRVNPEDHAFTGFQTVMRRGRPILKRLPRDVHGEGWQSVMRVLGVKDITRCHQYDTSSTKVIKSNSRQIAWKCSKCSTELMLTPAKSAKLALQPDAIWHRGCRGARLIRVDGAAPLPVATPVAPKVPAFTLASINRIQYDGRPVAFNAAATVPVPSLNAMSKIDRCKVIYQRNRHESRAMIIQMFVNAGCTAAGAATYYATCKKTFG